MARLQIRQPTQAKTLHFLEQEKLQNRIAKNWLGLPPSFSENVDVFSAGQEEWDNYMYSGEVCNW